MSTNSIFNYYAKFSLCSDKNYEIEILYPQETSSDKIAKIIQYGLSCCLNLKNKEIFVLVFTNQTGVHEYVYLMTVESQEYIAISSNSPYHSLFYNFLMTLYQYNDKKEVKIHKVLEKMWNLREFEKFSSLKINFGLENYELKLPIPAQNSTYFDKYLAVYIGCLEIDSIIDIHTSLLLERNILFISNSRSKLTACILAAHSLLYPMVWVHCLYTILPEFALEVLESPVPFIAGIHSCLYLKARKYLSAGTRLVDLDEGRIYLIQIPQITKKPSFNLTRNHSQNGLKKSKSEDSLSFDPRKKTQSTNFDRLKEPENMLNGEIPDVIVEYLEQGLKSVEKLQSRINNKINSPMEDKENLNEDANHSSLTSQCLIEPFFDFNVNILGFYSKCLEKSKFGGFLEPNIKKMIAIQGCPSIENFLREVYNSQMCRVFFDERVQKLDQLRDKFDEVANVLNAVITKKIGIPVENLDPEKLSVYSYGDSRWKMAKSSNIFSSTLAYRLFHSRSASSRLIDKIKKRSRVSVNTFDTNEEPSPPSTMTCRPISFNDNSKTWNSFSEKIYRLSFKNRSSLPKSSDFEMRKNRFVSTSSIDTMHNIHPTLTSIDEPVRLRLPSTNGRLQAVKITNVNSFKIKKPRIFLKSRPISGLDGSDPDIKHSIHLNGKNASLKSQSYENASLGDDSLLEKSFYSMSKPNSSEPTRRPKMIPPKFEHHANLFSNANSSDEHIQTDQRLPQIFTDPPRRPRLVPRRKTTQYDQNRSQNLIISPKNYQKNNTLSLEINHSDESLKMTKANISQVYRTNNNDPCVSVREEENK